MPDKNDKSQSTPSNVDETIQNTEEPTDTGSFMDRVMEVSERLLREHEERENKKRNAEDKGQNHS